MEKIHISNPEENIFPETKISELFLMVHKLKINEWEPFEFNNIKYQIIWTNKKDSINTEYDDAWFSQSTMIDGFDIYLQKSLSKEEKIKRLFHEILEANLRMKGFSSERAHSITFKEEEKVFGERNNLNKII